MNYVQWLLIGGVWDSRIIEVADYLRAIRIPTGNSVGDTYSMVKYNAKTYYLGGHCYCVGVIDDNDLDNDADAYIKTVIGSGDLKPIRVEARSWWY